MRKIVLLALFSCLVVNVASAADTAGVGASGTVLVAIQVDNIADLSFGCWVAGVAGSIEVPADGGAVVATSSFTGGDPMYLAILLAIIVLGVILDDGGPF